VAKILGIVFDSKGKPIIDERVITAYSPCLDFGLPLLCASLISSLILISVVSPSIRNIALLFLQRSLQRFQDRIGVSLVSPKLLSSPRFETKIVCILTFASCLATQQQRELIEGLLEGTGVQRMPPW
jgi:hypothetical protein